LDTDDALTIGFHLYVNVERGVGIDGQIRRGEAQINHRRV
jgi:hypothetical protein